MYDEELVDYIFVGNIRRMSELNKKYYYKLNYRFIKKEMSKEKASLFL